MSLIQACVNPLAVSVKVSGAVPNRGRGLALADSKVHWGEMGVSGMRVMLKPHVLLNPGVFCREESFMGAWVSSG